MNKRLYTAAALLLALCLTVFCTACREDTTADDPINLPQSPVQDDPQPPVQDEPQPPVQDEPQPPVQEDPQPPVQDDPRFPDDPEAVYDTYVLDIPFAASAGAKRADEESLRLYSGFMNEAQSVKAYDLQTGTEKTRDELCPRSQLKLFALVDFGFDGRLELILRDRNIILFCEDGKLYADRITSPVINLKYNGLCKSSDGNHGETYVVYNVSLKDGITTQTIASTTIDESTGYQSYYIYAEYEDGRYIPTEKRQVSKGEYAAFVAPVESFQNVPAKTLTTPNHTKTFSLYRDDLPSPTVVMPGGGVPATFRPDDEAMDANREIIRKYREFFGDSTYALDMQSGEKGSFYDLKDLHYMYMEYVALVDFGLDGVPEVVMIAHDSSRTIPVLYYEDGELYIDYVDNRQMQQLTYEGLCKNSHGGVDILTFSAEAGCQRRTVVSVSSDPDTGERKYFAHIDLTDGKYVPAEVTEITQAQFDGFWESRVYPEYIDGEKKYELLRVVYPPTPDESIIDANRDVLQVYYDFVNGVGTAIDVTSAEHTVFDYVIRHGLNPIVKFTLVDFGGDGVLEMVLEDNNNHFYTVLYYANDRLYTDSVTHRGLIGLTYTGIAYGSGGTSGRDYVLTFTPEKGLVEQNIASHGLDEKLNERYYLYATYENGRYIKSETREVTKYEYTAFLRDEVLAQWAKFNDDTLRRVLKIEPAEPLAPAQPLQPDDSDTVVLTIGDREITKAYAASLIEELEEWCNCRPFYSFDFADASQLTDDDLMRAYMVLMTPMEPVEHTQDRVTAELDKWFKGYSFDITRCTSVPAADEDPMPYSWQDLDIKVTDISAEGNLLTFRATLKEGWEKEYAIEFYEDGYYILKAQEILSPADKSEVNIQAMQAYYDFVTGKRDARHTSLKYTRNIETLTQYGDMTGFSFVDFGSDGVLEMVMRYESEKSAPQVLYWVDGELYFDSMSGTPSLELKVNGFCMYDTSYRMDLRYYYLERFAPGEQEYRLMLACETQPSKDDTTLARYRIYYDLINGEYVQRPCNATKGELRDFLQTYYDAPNIEWHDYEDVLGHEFFKDVAR